MRIRKCANNISPYRLKELLSYDQDTGVVTWRESRGNQFARQGCAAGYRHVNGYMCIEINRRPYLLHRVIWAIVTGEWPKEEIDHIDLEKANNRWINLREADRSQNCFNRPTRTDNTSGHKGVSRQGGKWKAKANGVYLGLFATLEEAAEAYRQAATALHGEFARHQ